MWLRQAGTRLPWLQKRVKSFSTLWMWPGCFSIPPTSSLWGALPAAKVKHFFGPSLTGWSRRKEGAHLDFNFFLVLKLAWILIQTGYCHMYSPKGQHLLVHPHSEILLKPHLCVKYKEKPHLFQTPTACCPPQRLSMQQPRNSAKSKLI